MPKGVKEAAIDSAAKADGSAEVSEEDYKEGQLRKGGQMSGEAEEESQ